MKKRFVLITLLCLAISFTGCGKNINNTSDKATEVLSIFDDGAKPVLSDGNRLYQVSADGSLSEIVISDDEGKVELRDFVQMDDKVCVLYSVTNDNYENIANKIAIIESAELSKTVELESEIPIYSAIVDAIDGDFYFSYSQYGEEDKYEYHTYVYDETKNLFVETDKFAEAETMMVAHQNDGIGYGMSPLEMYKKYDYLVYRNVETDAVFSNISDENGYTINPSYNGTIFIDYANKKGAVLYETVDLDSSTVNYEYYVDFSSGKTYEIGQGKDYRSFTKAVYDNYLVMVENISDEYGEGEYQYSLFDTLTGTSTVLFTNTVYGNSFKTSEEYNNAYVLGSVFYYQNVIDGKCEWYTCDLTEETHEQIPTGTVISENPVLAYGMLLHDSKAYYFEPGDEEYFADCFADSGIIDYEHYFSENKLKTYAYYVEGFQLNSDIKNADKINEKLRAVFDEKISAFVAEAEATKSMYIENGYFPGVYNFSTGDESINSVKLLGDKYIQIAYFGYDYFGGAHGMPYHDYQIYSLDTADEVVFEEIYSGTQEEFAKIVADYSIESYKNNDELYYPPFDENDDEYEADLYQQFLDGASLDMSGYFDGDNYVIEYAPYEYGPYAAGFIEVSIPLSKLGINF